MLDRIAGGSAVATTGPVDLPLGICRAKVTGRKAININVGSSVAPGEAPKLKFTVDPAHNARSGAAAMSWGGGHVGGHARPNPCTAGAAASGVGAVA